MALTTVFSGSPASRHTWNVTIADGWNETIRRFVAPKMRCQSDTNRLTVDELHLMAPRAVSRIDALEQRDPFVLHGASRKKSAITSETMFVLTIFSVTARVIRLLNISARFRCTDGLVNYAPPKVPMTSAPILTGVRRRPFHFKLNWVAVDGSFNECAVVNSGESAGQNADRHA
jgi:hypothetical protein